jgi:Fe-S-cluster containining protein
MAMREPVGFEVELTTSLGPIRGRVAVDPGPMGLVDLVSTTFELTNILVARANRREERAGRPITCRAGCGTCCCQMVALSIPEALHIADLVESIAAEKRGEVLRRFEEIAGELEGRGLIRRLLDPDYSDDAVLPIAKEYFFLRMPCPFLVADSCSIHPFRPLACREYNVTSPAAWCTDPYQYPIGKVPMPLPLSAPLAILTAQLTDSKPRLVPLTLGLRFAAEKDGLRRRRWPGLELFEKFMKVLGRRAEERMEP